MQNLLKLIKTLIIITLISRDFSINVKNCTKRIYLNRLRFERSPWAQKCLMNYRQIAILCRCYILERNTRGYA